METELNSHTVLMGKATRTAVISATPQPGRLNRLVF